MTSNDEFENGDLDETDVGLIAGIPLTLTVLASIDTHEYEALIGLEEAAAYRRSVFEAESREDLIEIVEALQNVLTEHDEMQRTQPGQLLVKIDSKLLLQE